MAVTITTVFDGTDTHIADVIYSATADKTATIAHTLAAVPQEVYITPLLVLTGPTAGTTHAATTIDSTNVVITKQSTAGTSNAAAQVRVIIKRPHTLGR